MSRPYAVMDDPIVSPMNLNVFGSNFTVYPSPPLSPMSFQPYDGSYFPKMSDYRISDRQHDALKLLLGGNHVRKIRSPRTVLDLGAGKGAWAVEIAQEFATADEVVGVDIESIAPQSYPPNCRFETSDLHTGIRYPENYFSFVHSRCMSLAIHDWTRYISEIYRVTATGGHIQLCEVGVSFVSRNGALRHDSGLKVMERALQKYAAVMRYDLKVGSKLSIMAEGAGFHSVEEKEVEVPLGTWESDPKSYKVGMWMAEHFSEQIGLVGRSSMIEIGIAEDVVDMYIEKAQRELKDPRLQLSVKLWYVTARKPGRSRSSSPRGSSHSPKRNGGSSPRGSPRPSPSTPNGI